MHRRAPASVALVPAFTLPQASSMAMKRPGPVAEVVLPGTIRVTARVPEGCCAGFSCSPQSVAGRG